MMAWVTHTYPGVELMSHPDLNVDVHRLIGTLLRPEHLKALEDEYLQNMQRNFQEWMTKAAETEKQEWFTESVPDQDDEFYHTSAPVIIFQMIDQHLQVTNTIHQELTFKALVMSIQQVEIFGQTYLKNVIELKEHHFRNRDQIKYFTHYIITIVNNSQQMVELAQQMKQLYWPKSRTEHYEDFERFVSGAGEKAAPDPQPYAKHFAQEAHNHSHRSAHHRAGREERPVRLAAAEGYRVPAARQTEGLAPHDHGCAAAVGRNAHRGIQTRGASG